MNIKTKRTISFIRNLILIISFLFLGYYLLKVDHKKLLSVDIQYTLTIVSVFLSIGFRYLITFIWFRSIAYYQNHRPTFRKSVSIYATSWIARYIPGGIFSHLERALLGKEQGINFHSSIQSSILETLMQIAAAAILSSSLLYALEPPFPRLEQLKLTSLAIGVVAICALTRPAINTMKSTTARLFQWEDTRTLSRSFLLPQFCLHILATILANTAFLVFAVSLVGEISVEVMATIVAANMLVSIASIVIIVVPAGLGVREAGLLFFLLPILDTELAFAISIASRVWTIICDVLFYYISRQANQLMPRNS